MAYTRTEVVALDRGKKTLTCVDLATADQRTIDYDKLILCTGAGAVLPPVPGAQLAGVTTLLSMADTDFLRKVRDEKKVTRVVIVGGGLIGVETCEALHQSGIAVTLVEMAPRILTFLDPQLARLIENHMKSKGVEIIAGAIVFPGTIQTSICKVFDFTAGSTGLSEQAAKQHGFADIVSVVNASPDKPGFIGAGLLVSKLVVDRVSQRILGYQCVGTGDVSRQMATAAMAIQGAMTLDRLTCLDICPMPRLIPWQSIISSLPPTFLKTSSRGGSRPSRPKRCMRRYPPGLCHFQGDGGRDYGLALQPGKIGEFLFLFSGPMVKPPTFWPRGIPVDTVW